MNVKLLLLALALSLAAIGGPNEIARQLRETGFDPQTCYRVRDLQLSREDARFYFNSGLLIFLKPLEGKRLAAVFSADAEIDDAELLLIPPTRGERASLASFTKSPNLDEHFRAALMLFTDGTAEELLKQISENEFNKKSLEEGFVLASKWDSIFRNLSSSFEVRLVEDLLAKREPKEGLFFATVSGRNLGNFDFICDPRARLQVTLGQIATQGERTFYDFWTHFQGQNFRKGRRKLAEPDFKIANYRIESRLRPDLHLEVVTRIGLTPGKILTVMPFEISQQMNVTVAEVDGEPAEVFRQQSLRSNLLRGDQNEVFLVAPKTPLQPGGTHEVTIHHDGAVIGHAGNNVYYVGARVNWYPRRGNEFATFDMTFRYPKNLGLVASGELLEERVEGEEKVAHRRSSSPVRYAGFNLGDYMKASATRGGYQVDAYANRRLEAGLQPRPLPPAPTLAPQFPRRRPNIDLDPTMAPLPILNPTMRLAQMAEEIATDYEWMASKLGPPPQKTLAVSPIPGQFGQGFAGLLYLSTLAYLDPQRGGSLEMQAYFSGLLHAHETAHQWWGNSVTSPGYEDDWLQEGLANYLALLSLEKRRGTKAMDEILGEFRKRLLSKNERDETTESMGPVTFGLRLQNSQNPAAWRTIVYDKGTWIMHMMHRRLGDDLFWGFLGDISRKYQYQSLSTQQFQDTAAVFLAKQPVGVGSYRVADPKFETFFDTWVQGTGIPSLKLNWTTKGAAPKVVLNGTLTQTSVPDDFTDIVPVEIQLARGKIVTHWVRTSSEPVTFTVTLPSVPLKVQLDPGNAVLRR